MAEAAPRDGWRTRGQDAALRAVRRAVTARAVPHAILLAGQAGSGKTTLALDLAAALLCTAPEVAARPCRECRGCRMVEHGNHPDLHRLAPSGAGQAIGIGGRDRGPGVRRIIDELALLPVEAGARVAMVESAERMTEEAQAAFLKPLEEPPVGVTIILCADEPDRLLPTIRSRCAHIRLGPVSTRTIEAILAEHNLADAPTAARLARLATGRPGVALAFARAPEAVTIRAEIARRLLDLAVIGRSARLAVIRELLARAGDLLRALDRTPAPARRAATIDVDPPAADADGTDSPMARTPAAERRRAALALVAIWRDLVRDLALVDRGDTRLVRDPDLLDELLTTASPSSVAGRDAFLGRLARAGELLEGNVGPELTLDVLALAWGRAA